MAIRTTLPPCSLPCLAAGFAALQMRQWLRRGAQSLGWARPSELRLDALALVDSALTREALALAEAAYDGHLDGHGHRTHARARAVAFHLGLTPDPEALFVACLLHDLGLSEVYAGDGPFELRGAAAAAEACRDDLWRAHLVHEAIALHTSLRAALGPAEVRLVQAGSGGDLVGLDDELIHPDTRRAIERRWPKAPGFAASIQARLREQTRAHPRSPGAGLLRVGFGRRLRDYDRQQPAASSCDAAD